MKLEELLPFREFELVGRGLFRCIKCGKTFEEGTSLEHKCVVSMKIEQTIKIGDETYRLDEFEV